MNIKLDCISHVSISDTLEMISASYQKGCERNDSEPQKSTFWSLSNAFCAVLLSIGVLNIHMLGSVTTPCCLLDSGGLSTILDLG